jgi:hypothetical protein
MTNKQTPTMSHEFFDAICAQVGDWEPLPTVAPERSERDEEATGLDEEAAPLELDRMILAGLVTPV